MRSKPFFLCAVSLGAALALPSSAEPPTNPPKVLWMFREEVKPARGAAHTAVEQGIARHFGKAGMQPYFALEALTGSATDVLFVSSYDSWDQVEKDLQVLGKATAQPAFLALARQEAELVNSTKGTLAVLREELSYRGEKLLADMPHSRYVAVMTMRVKPGHGEEFTEYQKANVKAHAEASMDESWLVYEVIGGAPMGTYLLFQPFKSFADVAANDEMHRNFRKGLSAETKALFKKAMAEDLQMGQWDYFTINPKQSNPPKEFLAIAPDFWGAGGETRAAEKRGAEKAHGAHP